MSLIVEDGTGLSTAQSYASVAECTAYATAHGNTTWAAAATDALREAALVRATAALDGLYGDRWPGMRLVSTQALDWPRLYAWDRDGYALSGVPTKLKDAVCEAAFVELAEAGALTTTAEVGIKSETIGPITTVYQSASAPGSLVYPAIRQKLARILKGGGGCVAIGGR